MDARTRKLVGWVITAVGAIIAFLGIFAGVLGIGDDDFGGLQITAVIIGVVVAAVGVVLTRWSPGAATAAGPSEATTASPTDT